MNWAKLGALAAAFPVREIADPVSVPFPGYDKLSVPQWELRSIVEDRRYADWCTALRVVKAIYLITDSSTGKHYVGKADGRDGILGRWAAYAHDGQGGNLGLVKLAHIDPDHSRHFSYSILRVFGPMVPPAEIDSAEVHYKKALQSVRFGLNEG